MEWLTTYFAVQDFSHVASKYWHHHGKIEVVGEERAAEFSKTVAEDLAAWALLDDKVQKPGVRLQQAIKQFTDLVSQGLLFEPSSPNATLQVYGSIKVRSRYTHSQSQYQLICKPGRRAL